MVKNEKFIASCQTVQKSGQLTSVGKLCSSGSSLLTHIQDIEGYGSYYIDKHYWQYNSKKLVSRIIFTCDFDKEKVSSRYPGIKCVSFFFFCHILAHDCDGVAQ